MAKQEFKTTENGTQLPLLNLRGKAYLQVAHRLVWFREKYPDGIIKTQLIEHQNEGALVRAEIYIPSANGQHGLVSTAYKMETKAGFADYIEKAETGAIGRALAMAGFGTQFEPEFDEGMRLADAPIDVATKSDKVENVNKAESTVNAAEETKVARPSFRRKAAEKKEEVNDSSGDL